MVKFQNTRVVSSLIWTDMAPQPSLTLKKFKIRKKFYSHPKIEIFKIFYFLKTLKQTDLSYFPEKTNSSSPFERNENSAHEVSYTFLIKTNFLRPFERIGTLSAQKFLITTGRKQFLVIAEKVLFIFVISLMTRRIKTLLKR